MHYCACRQQLRKDVSKATFKTDDNRFDTLRVTGFSEQKKYGPIQAAPATERCYIIYWRLYFWKKICGFEAACKQIIKEAVDILNTKTILQMAR